MSLNQRSDRLGAASAQGAVRSLQPLLQPGQSPEPRIDCNNRHVPAGTTALKEACWCCAGSEACLGCVCAGDHNQSGHWRGWQGAPDDTWQIQVCCASHPCGDLPQCDAPHETGIAQSWPGDRGDMHRYEHTSFICNTAPASTKALARCHS